VRADTVPSQDKLFFATVKEMSRRIATVVERNMKIPVYVSIEEDAWSSAGRKFSAVTAGGPGDSFFVGAHVSTGSENSGMCKAAFSL
jgi:hypothetical protein